MNDGEILFGTKFVSKSRPCFAGVWRVGELCIACQNRREQSLGWREYLKKTRRLTPQLDRIRIHNIESGLMQSHIIANLPGQEWMLIRRVISDQQNCRRVVHIAHRGCRSGLSVKRSSQSREV